MGKGLCRRRVTSNSSGCLADVTLNDCANNPKKTHLGKGKMDVKALSLPGVPDENTADDSDDPEEALPGPIPTIALNRKDRTPVGTTYPPDIWFLIAPYIPPEDLLRFALICKDAYKVLLSIQFWKQLCQRLRTDDPALPRSLQNPCDTRLGLRSRAIRLLFLRCPALVQRIKPPVAPRYEPYTLQGMRLVLAWHEKEDNHWNFWFKWTGQTLGRDVPKHHRSELFNNPEADFRILKATCSSFVGFPYPQYCYLSTVTLGLTSDMRGMKLSLGFSDYTTTHCSAKMKQSLGRNNVVQQRIDLEPVTRYVLMDWWHPEYPHPDECLSPRNLPCSTEEW